MIWKSCIMDHVLWLYTTCGCQQLVYRLWLRQDDGVFVYIYIKKGYPYGSWDVSTDSVLEDDPD